MFAFRIRKKPFSFFQLGLNGCRSLRGDFYENVSGWQMQVTSADEKNSFGNENGKEHFFSLSASLSAQRDGIS